MSDVVDVPHAIQAINRSGTAALTILVWDTLTSLDEEIALVWPLANNYWIKWAYLWNRYCPLALQMTLYGQRAAIVDFGWKLSQRACVRWFCVRAAATPIQLALVQPVLITRIRALYNCNRFVTGILLLIYAGTLVNLIVFASAILPGVITDYTCFPPENNKRLEVFYSATILPPLALDSVMLLLTMYKLFVIQRMPGARRGEFVVMLLRDGIWAYFVVFAAVLTNKLLQATHTGLIMWAAVDWVIATMSFVSSRLILNMLHYARSSRSSPLGSSSSFDKASARWRAFDGANDHVADRPKANFTSHVHLDYEPSTVSYHVSSRHSRWHHSSSSQGGMDDVRLDRLDPER